VRHAADDGVLASRLSAVEAALQDVLRSEPMAGPLDHAVADLARRVTTWEPTLAELERRTDAAVDTVGDDEPLRAEFELDSLDFLSFVETLSTQTGIRIDEADYPRLTTMRSCVAFLTSPA